jgi:hypothetical protein
VLPRLPDGEYYQLISDRFVAHRLIHNDRLAVVDLRTGRQVWQRDLTIGHLATVRAVGDVLVVAGSPYADSGHTVIAGGKDETVALDLASGAQLWRLPGTVLSHGVGQVVALWCNGCSGDAVGVDARTGHEIWRSPWLREGNLFDGRSQWAVAPDGTVRAVDLTAGTDRVVGNLAPGYQITGVSDRYVLAVPRELPGAGTVSFPSVSVFDRQTLRPVATVPISSHASFPPELILCGELICRRRGVDLRVYAQDGLLQYTKEQFDLAAVVHRGSESVIVGAQSRSGPLAPGVPPDSTQFLDSRTGRVLSEIGAWRVVRADADRLWVGTFASRGTSTMVSGRKEDARQTAIFGYVDLRPGSALTVTKVASLGGAYEDCDFDFGWLLCTNDVTGIRPVAIHLAANLTS